MDSLTPFPEPPRFESHSDPEDHLASQDDDEIVTYDLAHEDLFPRTLISEFKTQVYETRPQTDQGINRYNTLEVFGLEEDDLASKLSFQERLNNPKWQIRKKLYIDITDCLRAGRFLINIESELSVFEYFEPFLKNLAWDSNLTSQIEGLACILVYCKLVPQVKNSLFYLADELIPKCALTKQKNGELVNSILLELIRRDVEGQLVHCVVKRFTAKNPKEACFSINCVKNALGVMQGSESICRNMAAGLNKTLTHSTGEVRTASLALAVEIFAYVTDDAETYIRNLELKAFQSKEFRDLVIGKEKVSGKWTLFNKESRKNESNDLLFLEEHNESFVVDLNTLIPEGFYDLPYSTEIKANREKLVKLTHSLEAQGLVLEKKDYPTIVNTLLHLIESNNNLIYTEAIKILEILVPKVGKSFTFKYKYYVQFLSDKFKEKKKSLVSSIFNIFHLFRVHEVCGFDQLADILVDKANHKVPHVRELSLLWILQEIKQLPVNVDLLGDNFNGFDKVVEAVVLNCGNKVLKIALNDTVGSVRDAAGKLLHGIKGVLPGFGPLDTLINRLPKVKVSVLEVRKERDDDFDIREQKEPLSQIPEFPSLLPGIPDKDQFSLTMILEDIKRYAEGIYKYELVMTNLKKMERNSVSASLPLIIETITSTFSKYSHARLLNKLETAVLELNLLCESLIREVGTIEDSQIPKLCKLVLQFPGYLNKPSHKLVESTLDSLILLSNQIEVISNSINFISELRLKTLKITTDEKATTCLKFSTSWLLKKLDKNIVRSNSDKFMVLIDFILDIREQEAVFGEVFVKELQSTKNCLSNHIRKLLAGDVTPVRSRSPNLSISEIEVTELDPTKELKSIQTLLKGSIPSQKLSGLNRLIILIEQLLSLNRLTLKNTSNQTANPDKNPSLTQNLLKLSIEDLETLIKDLIFLCTKYKKTQQLSQFEELQQTTLTALTSLRLILSDKEAESVFKQLLFHLPTKNSNSSFAKTFNLQVYQLFSDWLSHLPTSSAINLVSECLKLDFSFNIHSVYIHILQWLLEIELKFGNFQLNILDPISIDIVSGLFGGPLNSNHPLSDNTKQLLEFQSQIFIEYLIEVFTLDNVSQFFEEKLMNCGKLNESFKLWTEKYKENLDLASISCPQAPISTIPEKQNIANLAKAPEKKIQDHEDLMSFQVDNQEKYLKIPKESSHSTQIKEEKPAKPRTRFTGTIEISPIDVVDLTGESKSHPMASTSAATSSRHTEESRIKEKLDEVVELHEETRRNLEEVNKEYLNQVTVNYELMQRLERIEKSKKLVKPENQKPAKFKPYTDLDDLLKTKPDAFPKSSAATVFELDRLDEPVVPYYLQPEEIHRFQQKLLQPNSNLSKSLINDYKTLNPSHKKPFLQFISKALSNSDILNSIEKPALQSLIFTFVQFCVIEKMASKDSSGFLIKTFANSDDLELTNELQRLLAYFLEFYEPSVVVACLIETIVEIIPENFYVPLKLEQKHGLKLLLKFLIRVVHDAKGLRVFYCLLSLNGLFVSHPPEKLNSESHDVQEYEYMFKALRNATDLVVAQGPEKALGFIRYLGEAGRSVYVRYIAAVLLKKYGLSN